MGEEFYVKGTWGHENKSKNKIGVCETNAHGKALSCCMWTKELHKTKKKWALIVFTMYLG